MRKAPEENFGGRKKGKVYFIVALCAGITMEVILIKDTERIGKAGQIAKVKDGFARNYLIPRGLAVAANSLTLKKLEQDRQKSIAEHQRLKEESEQIKGKLEGLSLTLPVLAQEEDKIYGSIGPQDIATALKEEGIDINKKSIILDEPIKSLGIYEIPVKLHPEVSAKIKLWVVKK